MLRPATPLSILLFVALALLIISVISVPIVKGVKLATFQGVDFGVFGYCKDSKCSKVMLGYSTDNLFKQGGDDFSLPSSARHSLSAILIVHPIAAVLTFILLILSLSAHLHSPSHSPRYLLVLLILTIPTLLLALLAFLVDLLLFVPHMQWGGWIVLAATIIIAASGIITCAMRRTLVGRKARQRRIAQNPEMSGENFRKQMDREPTAPTFATAPTLMVNGTPGADKLPEFTTLGPDASPQSDGINNDERTLLSSRSPPHPNGGMSLARNESSDRFESPQRMGPGPGLGRGRGYGGSVDDFGLPLPQGFSRDSPDSRLRQQYSDGNINFSNAAGRGRGYGPNGRSYGRGGPPPQGGFRGPTPVGMNGGRGIGLGTGPEAMIGGPGREGQRGPPPGYNNRPAERGDPYSGELSAGPGYGQRGSPGAPLASGYRKPTPGPSSSPGPYNAYNGPAGPESRSPPPPVPPMPVQNTGRMGTPGGFPQWTTSDSDLRGMVDLQQGRISPRQPSGMSSDDSVYSQTEYVPARSNWANGGREGTRPVQPTNTANFSNAPVELPTPFSDNSAVRPPKSGYYEDVDSRFVEQNPAPPIEIPASLTPGYSGNIPATIKNPQSNQQRSSDADDGSHGSAASATNNPISASQRPGGPGWKPTTPVGGQGVAPRGPTPQQQAQPRDVIDGNPDFQISAGRGLGRQAPGTGDTGRYPGPSAI